MLSGRSATVIIWCIFGALVTATAGTVTLVSSEAARDYVGLGSKYRVGQRLDTENFYKDVENTVVLFARSTCGASVASTQQLRSLASVIGGMANAQFVVIPTATWSDGERNFVRSIGLAEENVRRERVEELKVRVVPTLAVVDHHGRIRYLREGRLGDADVAEVKTLLKAR
jgi:hypothetical protein